MSFENECLEAHNRYRQQHGATPLKLNPQISAECRQFAEELIRESCLRNGSAKEMGENIYAITSTNPNFTISGGNPVDHWYSKHELHNYHQEPSGQLQAGNFTQVVWKNSRELGVGFAKQNGKIIVVARYYPAGNVMGQFCENVGKKGEAQNSKPNTVTSAPACNLQLPPKQVVCDRAGARKASFHNECLQAHNAYRAKHGVPPLSLDDDLCRYSQDWADHLASLGKMQHRNQSTYGENIFSAWSSDPNFSVNGSKAVDSWYDEIKYYTFGREPTDLKAGHFTQVVWKGSSALGVGFSQRNGHVYVVCNYSPPGNYVGNYINNVPSPL